MRSASTFVAASTLTAVVAGQAGSLKDIKHIVLFMQENRAFDHYYGTMAGVRGFADPNVQVNPNGKSVFQQTTGTTKNGVNTLQPWHLTYPGGTYLNSTQCGYAGSNGWQAVHTAYDEGLADQWVAGDTANSLGYFTRSDIPTQWDIVDGWTVLDMSQESILGATDPNRVMWISGSINTPGSPTNPDGKGGLIVDNTITPGCEAPGINCYPFVWKTFPEYLEAANISWQVWQDFDNFQDNPMPYFQQIQDAKNGSALQVKGNSYPGLDAFYGNASAGTLPQISYIIGPQELSEHPPNRPVDGAYLQQRVVEAITQSPAWKETVLIISYDEQGGWADHVVPFVAPEGTPGEWITDPYNASLGQTPIGPGWRTPRYIVSPWTRGGNVFTEHADHTSDIMFVEQWAQANGYPSVHCEAITPWRRAHMSNLVNALDFANPDYSIPSITKAPTPAMIPNVPGDYSGPFYLGSNSGDYLGPSDCLADYPESVPPVPYGPANANANLSTLVEDGFKRVRGNLTEGRYLTFESSGAALTSVANTFVTLSPASSTHNNINQRFILHYVDSSEQAVYIQSAANKKYISGLPIAAFLTSEKSAATPFTLTYTPSGATYAFGLGSSAPKTGKTAASGSTSGLPFSQLLSNKWEIFSVSYKS